MALRMRNDKGCSLSPGVRNSRVSAVPGAAGVRPKAWRRDRSGTAAGQHDLRRNQGGSGSRTIARNRRCLRPRFRLVATGRHGFAVLLSGAAACPNSCFNWFRPLHTQRSEVLSVRQMIERMLQDVSRRGLPPASCRGAASYQAAPCIPLFVHPNVFHPPIIVDAVDLRHDADHVRLPAGSATIMHDDRPRAVLLQLAVDLPYQL